MTTESFCNKCSVVTTWKQGPKYEICQTCNGRFPCPQGCAHADCGLARGDLVLDTLMCIREKSEFGLDTPVVLP